MRMLGAKGFGFLMTASPLLLGLGCDFSGSADMGGTMREAGATTKGVPSFGGSGVGGTTQTSGVPTTFGVGGTVAPVSKTDTGGAGAVGGAGPLGGASAGGGTAPTCFVKVSKSPDTINELESGTLNPAYVWSGASFVGVASGSDRAGYRVVQLAPSGTVQGTAKTLWADTRAGDTVGAAVSGDALAIVDKTQDATSQRAICRLAMARLPDVVAVRAPTRVSDAPAGSTILNEVYSCTVAAVTEGFLVLWHQSTSATSDELTLFAQRVDRDGNSIGERVTLASGDKRLGLYSATSDGTRAVVAFAANKDAPINLAFIENGEVSTTALDVRVAGSSLGVNLAKVPAGFLARAGNAISVLDRDGRLVRGPTDVDTSALLAPLDQGYVVVSRDEYLVASSLDSALSHPSAPTALSEDRSSSAVRLVAAPDGSAVALIYFDAGQRRFARLECTGAPPSSLGPRPCPEVPEVAPLSDDCSESVCHTIVRLDYMTLGLRGWAVIGGPANSTDSAGAASAAGLVFAADGEYLSTPVTMSEPKAGLFKAFIEPTDFGAFALVGEASGLVVAAGGIVWAGTGHGWVPTSWRESNDLVCGNAAVAPEQTYVDTGKCSSGETEPTTASQALSVVLRSNLAAHVKNQGTFSAFVYLYTPSVGVCSPERAEYLVVLTREK